MNRSCLGKQDWPPEPVSGLWSGAALQGSAWGESGRPQARQVGAGPGPCGVGVVRAWFWEEVAERRVHHPMQINTLLK